MVDSCVFGTLACGGQYPLGAIVGGLKCRGVYGACVLSDLNREVSECGDRGDSRLVAAVANRAAWRVSSAGGRAAGPGAQGPRPKRQYGDSQGDRPLDT